MNKQWTHFNLGCVGIKRMIGLDGKRFISNIHISILEIIIGKFDGSLFRISYKRPDGLFQWDILYLYQYIDRYKRRKEINKDLDEYFETELRHSKEIDDKVFNNGGRD